MWGILHRGHQWLILADFGFWSLGADCGFWTLVANFGFWIVLANFGHSWQISFFNLQYFSGNFSQTAFGGSQRFESCRYPKFRNFRPPGATFPTLCEKCVGSLTSPANQYRDAGDIHLHVLTAFTRSPHLFGRALAERSTS